MIYAVYINDKGFINTFDKTKNTYSTTRDIFDADFNSKLEHAQDTAEFFGGTILAYDDKDDI